MIKVIVFDLDDTLYPEREYIFSGFRAVAEKVEKGYELEDFYSILVKIFSSGQRDQTFNKALEKVGVHYSESYISKLVEIYRKHSPQIELFDDASFTLKNLRELYKLGLISDGYLRAQRKKLDALGIRDFFHRIILTDKYGREKWKPNKFSFKKMMEYFGVRGRNCVYVGDNPKKDFYGPNQLDWFTIQVNRKEAIHQNESRETKGSLFQPNMEIDNLTEILSLLEREYE